MKLNAKKAISVDGSMSNSDIEDALNKLPDMAADALLAWRLATIERERIENDLMQKAHNGKNCGWDACKVIARAAKERLDACRIEAQAEVLFWRLNERLLAIKKTSGIRTAF